MAYGIIIYNANGDSIIDSRTDKCTSSIVTGSVSISLNSAGSGTSSSIAFTGMTTSNNSEYDVFIYDAGAAIKTGIGITRGTNSFTITAAGTANTSVTLKYAGVRY